MYRWIQTIKTFSQKFSKTQAVEETLSWRKYGNYYTTITAYQASPTLRDIQEIQPFRRESAARSSSEGSKSVRKPRQLRVFKQRDVV